MSGKDSYTRAPHPPATEPHYQLEKRNCSSRGLPKPLVEVAFRCLTGSKATPVQASAGQCTPSAPQCCTPVLHRFQRVHYLGTQEQKGFVYLPKEADCLAAYLRELRIFPKGNFSSST